RDFQEINYSEKIVSGYSINNDNHSEGVSGGCRRQPPLTPSNTKAKTLHSVNNVRCIIIINIDDF
ncbi:MAG: hypothetical protein RM368_38985, partial [Nostoc sp. DedSLP03]|uniref:hypothetical protein n=1 Tax=Nostoc sp. DedSLP03 TaxID=3075400 RepID=UPI002AD58C76